MHPSARGFVTGWMVVIKWCQDITRWRMTDATYKCADGADGGAGSAIGLGTISTLNLRVGTEHEFLVIALIRSLPGIISIFKSANVIIMMNVNRWHPI